MHFGPSPGFYQFNTTISVAQQWPSNNSLLVFTWLNDMAFFWMFFFSGTISLFYLIKGRRRLKENKPPPLSLISSNAALPASSLVLKVSKDFYLSRWWSRGPCGTLITAQGALFCWLDQTRASWIHLWALREDLSSYLPTPHLTQTQKSWKEPEHKYTNTSVGKQPETTFTQKRTSTCAQVDTCAQTLRLQSSVEC